MPGRNSTNIVIFQAKNNRDEDDSNDPNTIGQVPRDQEKGTAEGQPLNKTKVSSSIIETEGLTTKIDWGAHYPLN